MISKYIKIFIILAILVITGCSSNNKNLEKNNDLFKEDNSELKVSKPFIVNEEKIILKKSKYMKKNEPFKKIDLGSL